MEDVAIPSACTGDVPTIVLLAATAVPPMKIEGPPDKAKGVRRFTVLASALVDLSVQLETPAAELTEQVP
jgi:hypothetical protein